MSTTALSEILTNTNSPIANRLKTKTNSSNSTEPRTNVIVDMLLADYGELIDPAYKGWFARKFYIMRQDMIHRAASEARQEGRDPKKLFAYKISQYAKG